MVGADVRYCWYTVLHARYLASPRGGGRFSRRRGEAQIEEYNTAERRESVLSMEDVSTGYFQKTHSFSVVCTALDLILGNGSRKCIPGIARVHDKKRKRPTLLPKVRMRNKPEL